MASPLYFSFESIERIVAVPHFAKRFNELGRYYFIYSFQHLFFSIVYALLNCIVIIQSALIADLSIFTNRSLKQSTAFPPISALAISEP